MSSIPSYQEQADLAERVHSTIGRAIEIDGRRYGVSRHGNDIRFNGRSKFQGEIGPSAIVQILRANLATIATSPGGYRDRKLEDRALGIVRAALEALR
jgi:hypothetical protein